MRIDPIWRPLLALGAASPENSYVEVRDASLDLRFGALFHEVLPRRYVVSASEAAWPWWIGVGWRGWGDQVGLIGSTSGVVELRLSDPVRVRLGLPWPFAIRRISISLEDPQGFIAAVNAVPVDVA